MKKKIIYPGTFDPVTNGHINIIQRATRIFDEIIVAVAENTVKKPYFDLKTRIALLENSLLTIPGVQIVGFNGLLIHFAQQQNAHIILRGLRPINDFEHEFQLAGMNRQLSSEIETVFLIPDEHLMFISSSLVKEIALFHGDISTFVPKAVTEAFKKTM